MKKALGQTVRDLKREVNKKVLKVPGIEQKILDATSNEAWGPHGALLAEIALATKNYHEYQMIMAVIWKRINDTGKNWRHVYKALIVLEYLVAHGSERVIEEIREHAHQISTLSNFQYIDSSGRDQGNNVRKKSQSLVLLVNDKEKITEVREKAASNRDKFRNNSTDGMYRPGSYSSSGAYGDRYDDDRYGSKEEDRSGYGNGQEGEWRYRDDDRYSRDGDRYGRGYEERYSRDGYKDDEYRGRSQSVDDYQYGSRSRSSDRDHDRSYDDDGQRSSRAKAEDHSLERRLEQKLSEKNMVAPPSYEEAVSQSPLHNERDGETSAASAPRGSSASDNPHQTSAPTGSSPLVSDNSTEATAAASTATSGNWEVEASDEFDPRGPGSAAPAPVNNVEMDLFGSLSESFSSNALALVPSASETTIPQDNANLESTASFAPLPSASNNFNPLFEDPFGDSPFKAIPSTETAPSQLQTHQSLEPSQSSAPITETVSNFGFGDSFSVVPYSTSGASDTKPLSSNIQFLPQDMCTPPQETDILADILPPAPLPGTSSQQNFSAPANAQSSPAFSASSGQMASQFFFVPTGQLTQQGFSAATSQPIRQTFSVPTGQHAQHPFPVHADQPAQLSGHIYGGFHSQFQSGPMNSENFLPQGATAPQAPTVQLSQHANYFPQQFNSVQQVNAVSQSSKDKFETKSTVWADTLSRGLVNLNISGSKINPLADIGIDFDAINRKDKRMEKPTTTPVTSTVTMGKAMGSGSGIGRAGAGALRPMGMGMGGGYGGINVPMGMGPGVQMQRPVGSNVPSNYNYMIGTNGYPQQPYGGGGGGYR
ncbi:clathrin interactor EPSIN 2-like [Gastrolobium bilobum]|uniref:clathrin interactor EPSIN 2-like n=1 Tax=Gastrolobium bilobum TaxID=150636 RepID=UPI002AB1048F|nr:clathrin interactor EPSIN 2-like [Gastrolobium bilobum]XP_061360192.1 clathrin interactor EPSIN 2-like [Gastrolobium bilobum]XP_061360193.1 clathrin interactor EPSIN 2-like [Gastrolobium bilobum]